MNPAYNKTSSGALDEALPDLLSLNIGHARNINDNGDTPGHRDGGSVWTPIYVLDIEEYEIDRSSASRPKARRDEIDSLARARFTKIASCRKTRTLPLAITRAFIGEDR